MKQTIDNWSVEDKTFISTKAHLNVLFNIRSQSCVAVTGSSGSGKTAIVRHVSLILWKESGYEITTISNSTEFKNYYKRGRKTLFVMDDMCGKFTIDNRHLDNWLSIIDIVDQVIADPSCKILFSCRLQVYKDPKFADLTPFKLCECNIISDELSLTIEEKRQFVENYLNTKNIKADILARKNDLFPLLCVSYLNKKKGPAILDIEKYLSTPPKDLYLEEINKLKRKGKDKLCGLCLCIMFNNKLEESHFSILSENFQRIVEETCIFCGLNKGTAPSDIRDSLDSLDTTYIKKHDGLYEIYHDTLFDIFSFHFGQEMTQLFIKFADSGYLRDRFLWEKLFDTEDHSIENIVLLKDVFLQPFINRLIDVWADGKVSDVFYNINMKSRTFREEILKSLKKSLLIKAKKLARMKDYFREDFASGNTPLIISSVNGYTDLLHWLIEHEADVNDRRKDGSSALYMGCEKNYVDVVRILLKNNADVNLCKNDGVSPLGAACYFHGNLEIVSELLKKDAEINMHRFSINNMTPLFMACEKNFVSTVEQLLNHGADPEICLHNGMSVLLSACQNENIDIVRLLIQAKANTNVEMHDGDTPLFSASRMGLKDITEVLLQNGADLNKCLKNKDMIEKYLDGRSKSFENEKQLWLKDVERYGSTKTKEYVRTRSADYVFNVFAGSSPLHAACFMGHTEVSQLLIEQLSCVDIRKEDGTTPLFYACEVGHLEIICELLDKGANQNLCREDGSSPLIIATVNERVDVLSLLIKK
ncbi:Hypothetical predicted protein [Mytilus galloprovincialis]|uniref:Novel STAND NTPase 3 domain-containing protein n=1 Tax=Mytilus galloprovincialis TaxID=29158 RepID=A0A8B6DW02_MYTGA|nr:Hypothetical predicted protein [Mytilus galloprovincialis]